MNREEAIKVLEKQFDKSCGNYHYQNAEKLDFEDALWVAISAIRQQEAVTNRNEPLTNAQKIRSMSDEELAEFLWDFNLADVSTVKMGEFGPHMFRYRLKEWLQQPAEEDDHA